MSFLIFFRKIVTKKNQNERNQRLGVLTKMEIKVTIGLLRVVKDSLVVGTIQNLKTEKDT